MQVTRLMKPLARPLKAGDALLVVWRPEQQADVDHARQGCAEAGTSDSRRAQRERRAPTQWWQQQGLSVGKVVYDCKVTNVISSSKERAVVDAQLLKADGSLFAELQLTLAASALCNDANINASLQHLTWAFKAQQSGKPQGSSPPAQSSRPVAREQARHDGPPIKRSKPAAGDEQQVALQQEVVELKRALKDLQSKVTVLTGRVEAYDATTACMTDYAMQQARLSEEVRKLKAATGVDAMPGSVAPPSSNPGPNSSPAASVSDPVCSVCAKQVAYDMPLKRLVGALIGPGKVDLGELFSMPAGRVKANSALKKLVQCDDCSQKGEPKLVVCTSGGAGNRIMCDWCRCRMTTNTTDAASMWCGSKHNNCRQLIPENESNRQGCSICLAKGLMPVKETVPYDEVKLIDVDLSSYNNADYVVVAKSSLNRAMVLIEIDNNQHAGGGQYSPELEAQKNTGNFACGTAFDRVLFLRINPSGKYQTPGGEANMDKKARWLIARDWIACFLRGPWGAWTQGGATGKTLVYLFYNHNSSLIDRRPAEFSTVVAYSAPALPTPALPDLADWACALDPYLIVKGSTLAREHLALAGRHPQPARQ